MHMLQPQTDEQLCAIIECCDKQFTVYSCQQDWRAPCPQHSMNAFVLFAQTWSQFPTKFRVWFKGPRPNPITVVSFVLVKAKQRLDRPQGFHGVETPRFHDSRHMKLASLSAIRTGCLYPPGNNTGTHSSGAESTLGPCECGRKDYVNEKFQ